MAHPGKAVLSLAAWDNAEDAENARSTLVLGTARPKSENMLISPGEAAESLRRRRPAEHSKSLCQIKEREDQLEALNAHLEADDRQKRYQGS